MGRRDRENDRRKQIWMSVFISFIMIFSVFGIFLGQPDNGEIKIGKYKFEQVSDGVSLYYVTKIDGKQTRFYSLPSSNFNMSSQTAAKIKDTAFLVLTFNPELLNDSAPYIELARLELEQGLAGKTIYPAKSVETEQYPNLPVFSCENASFGVYVVMFNVSDKPEMVDTGNCLYLNGRAYDFLRMRDEILYNYYGVIDDV